MGNPTQLLQVFQNLIANAIKFRSKENPEIKISAELMGDEWLFSIKDEGIGISPKDHSRVFEIFTRLHERDKYPGTGIGLAICKQIIESRRGRIWVESDLDKGSTFYFTLPAWMEKKQVEAVS